MRADSGTGKAWKSPGKKTFYLAYFVLLVCIFAYILFPSDRAATYLSDRLGIAAPGYSVMIDGIKPAFPPGLHATGIHLDFQNREVLRIDSLKITPRLLALVRMRPAVTFKGSAYGGRFDGRGEVGGTEQTRRATVSVNVSAIGLENLSQVRELTGHGITGVLDGTAVLNAVGGFAESAKADLVITDAIIDPPAPVMTVDRLRFKRVEAEIAFESRRLTIGGCRFQGPQMDGRIAGTIALKRPFGASRLDLEGTVRPHTEFLTKIEGTVTASADFRKTLGENGLSFQFSGTYDRPNIALVPGTSR